MRRVQVLVVLELNSLAEADLVYAAIPLIFNMCLNAWVGYQDVPFFEFDAKILFQILLLVLAHPLLLQLHSPPKGSATMDAQLPFVFCFGLTLCHYQILEW